MTSAAVAARVADEVDERPSHVEELGGWTRWFTCGHQYCMHALCSPSHKHRASPEHPATL